MKTKVVQIAASQKELVFTAVELIEVEMTLRDNGVVNFFTDDNGGALSLDTDVPRLVRLSIGDRLYLQTDSPNSQLVEILIQEPSNEPLFEDFSRKNIEIQQHIASILEYVAKRVETGIAFIVNSLARKEK